MTLSQPACMEVWMNGGEGRMRVRAWSTPGQWIEGLNTKSCMLLADVTMSQKPARVHALLPSCSLLALD
eukprot:47883-Chlamydomonas_euryale.AAC.1